MRWWASLLLCWPIILRASADEIADIRAVLHRLKDENEALTARVRILEGGTIGQGTPPSESTHGTQQLTEKGAEAQGRRRLTDTRSGKITYDGSQFIISGPVEIQGSLNVTGIVTDTTPVVATSTTSDFVGFTAQLTGFALSAVGSYSVLTDWTVQNSAGIQLTNTYGTDGFDATTGEFTAPVDGVYYCHGNVQVTPEDGGSFALEIATSIGNGDTSIASAARGAAALSSGSMAQMVPIAALLSMSASSRVWLQWQAWAVFYIDQAAFTCFLAHET